MAKKPPEESILITLSNKKDERSDFDKAFEDDSLHQLQTRMLAKAKTKKFEAEDFVEKAKEDFSSKEKIEESPAGDLPETPEPEEEQEEMFFF